MNVFQKFKEYAMPRQAGRQAYNNALVKNPSPLIFCLFFILAAFAFTGCTLGGEHTFDLTIQLPMEPQSKASLPSKLSNVTIVAYLAGDYAHHTKEEFENVPAGTSSLPITLGGIPLGKSTVVIEAKAEWKGAIGDTPQEGKIGYYAEQEIVVTGGVNSYTVDMDYGLIVKCGDTYGCYSGRILSGPVVGFFPDQNHIGERPLAAGDFLILQQGKTPSEQRNFSSRLPYNLTAEGDSFEGYVVRYEESGVEKTWWLYDYPSPTDNFDGVLTAPKAGDNQYLPREANYKQGSPTWYLYSAW